MDSFKEFEGKSLDEAISEACGYFDTPREKLEIEILQDSKSGIFGLVGARKAKVRARRVLLRAAVEDILGRKHGLTLGAGDEREGEREGEVTPDALDKHHDKGHEKHHDRYEKRDKPEKHDRQEKQDRQEKSGARPEKGHEKSSEKSHDKVHEGGHERGHARHADTARHRHGDEHAAHADHADESLTMTAEDAVALERLERLERGERPERNGRPERNDRPVSDKHERNDGRRARPAPKAGTRRGERPAGEQANGQASGQAAHSVHAAPFEGRQRPKAAPRPRHDETPSHGDAFGEEVLHEDGDNLQRIPFEDLDQDRLRALSLEVVGKLVAPIVGELPLTVELQDGRVNVRMDCGDDSGLLIGREGQTLASLQYLASRMVSRGMNTAVRVQLDAGEYRLRQDEKLREMALGLADKVRATGKSHSTRPLSSYHRRIVHLVLQDSTEVQTRSSGDGPLKRVVVQRKRG